MKTTIDVSESQQSHPDVRDAIRQWQAGDPTGIQELSANVLALPEEAHLLLTGIGVAIHEHPGLTPRDLLEKWGRNGGSDLADELSLYLSPDEGTKTPILWTPFPLELLPSTLRAIAQEGAASIGADPASIAFPALVAVAGTVGNAAVLQITSDWEEPAVLWAGVVVESGERKSPTQALAFAPLKVAQRERLAEYAAARKEYEAQDLPLYQKALTRWKSAKGEGEAPERPEEPRATRYVVSDTTVESLSAILQDNPRGLVVVRDELAGWFKGFNQYRGGRGSDAAQWCELHRAGDITVDRKSGAVHVPRAAVSLSGAIQPETLKRVLDPEFFEMGLVARLLLVRPPRQRRRWSDRQISTTTQSRYHRLLRRLLSLPMRESEWGSQEPNIIPLATDAREAFASFVDEFGEERMDLQGPLAAASSKLEGAAARLALLLHLASWAEGDDPQPGPVTSSAMRSGIALGRWLWEETQRIYGQFSESDRQRDRREILEWVARRGGAVSPRDLTRGPRRFRGRPDVAETVLRQLAREGYGQIDVAPPGSAGGQPSLVFQLLESGDGDTTPKFPEENEVPSPPTPGCGDATQDEEDARWTC